MSNDNNGHLGTGETPPQNIPTYINAPMPQAVTSGNLSVANLGPEVEENMDDASTRGIREGMFRARRGMLQGGNMPYSGYAGNQSVAGGSSASVMLSPIRVASTTMPLDTIQSNQQQIADIGKLYDDLA